jgi:large repetitive protein
MMNYILTKHENRDSSQNWLSRSRLFKPPLLLMGLLCTFLFLSGTTVKAQNPLWGIKDYTNLGYFSNTSTYPWTWTSWATLSGGNYNATASLQGNRGIIFNQTTRVFHLVNTSTGTLTAMTITNSGSIPRALNYNVAAYDPVTSRLFIANENDRYGHIFTVNIAGNSVTYVSEKDFGQALNSDDWAFIDGKVIGLDNNWVEIWDIATNGYTEINPVGGTWVGEIQGAWSNNDGTIGVYGENNNIYRYNPTTNTTTLLGTSSTGFSNGGEPHDMARLGIGMTVSPLTWGVNNPYTGAVVGAGGVTPYTYAITAGSLPTGLSLNTATGAITGTPSVVGSFPVTFQVTDVTTPTALTTTTNVTFTIGTDTDGDGILDDSDIDDDNDGILDKLEYQCPTFATWTDWTSLTAYSSATGTLALTGGNVNVTYTSSQVISIQGISGSYFNLGDAYAGTMPTSGIEGLQAHHGAGLTHTYTFSQPVKDPILVFWSMNSNTFTFTQPFTLLGQQGGVTSTATRVIGAAGECNAAVQFNGTFTSISYTSTILEGWTGVTVGVQQCNFNLDSDTDGTVNARDLDSDNDGCSDAYEGGATTDKATPNFKFNSAVGTNGLANSLETVADNGVINYSPAYNSFAMDAAKSRCLLKAPGGVPGANVWLKADAGTNTTTTGAGVSAWVNQGESGGTAGQFMTCALPTFTNNKHNFNPAITDNSTACAGALKLENVFASTEHRDLTTFAVKSLPDVGVQRMLYVFTPNTAYGSDREWPWIATENANTSWFWWSGNYANTTAFANTSRRNNTPWIDGYSLPKWTSGTHTTTRYLNGATATHSGGVNAAYGVGHNLFINADATGDNPSGGDLSEIVAYDRVLSATETDQVQTYLAVKYGTTLLNNAGTATKDYLNSLGTKVWDIAANAGYNNNIAGIARDTNSELHQKQSRSVNTGFQPIIGNGTGISATNAANTNNFAAGIHYEMIGDNGLSSNYSVAYAPTSFTPAAGFFRMPRIWKVQETGTVGTVTISVPAGVERLLVSNTSAFTPGAGTQEIAMTTDGSGNVTAQVDFTNGQFFSFGRSAIGPGGVTAMAWWFTGDKGVGTSGTAVTQWEDQSLNGLDVTQATAGKQPAATSFQNFNPVVTFTGNKALNNTAGYWKNSTNNAQFNVFAVAKHTINTGSVNALFAENTNKGQQSIFFDYGNNMYLNLWASHYAYTPFTAASSNVPLLVSSRYNNTGSVKQIYWNGRTQTMTQAGATGTFNGSNGNLVVGNHNDQGSWPFDGDIAEMVMYPTDLTAVQRQEVESYLALKWGLTLDQTTAYNYLNSNGATIWNATTNSSYKNNIFGIGTDAASGLSQKQSRSINAGVQPVFGLGSIAATNAANTANFTADMSFLIAGSDNGVAKFYTPITAPAGNDANNRFTRIWRVQETGTVGTVQFAIPSSVSGGNTIYLVRSTDATFDATDTWIPLSTNVSISNMAHAAGNVDFNNGDFFTVATYVGAPGCVATNLNFWLKADAIGEEDGASLAEWENQANTTLDSVGQVTAGARPTYFETNAANLVNFNPSVSFDGGDELRQASRLFSNTSAFTTIALAVDRRTNAGELRAPLGLGDGNFPAMDFQTDGVSPFGFNPWSSIDGEWNNQTPNYRLNSLGLGATNQSGNIVGLTSNNIAGGSDNIISYVNGSKDNTTISANQNAAFGNGMYVGSSGGEQWLGLIPEIMVYDKQLTDAEMQRVYSYLAIKYGVTLRQPYVNSAGTVIYDTTGYANNIAGIGREICQTLHQKQSRSMLAGVQPVIALTSIATTNTGNNAVLNDGAFMIWGSDNGAAVFGTPLTAPAGVSANNRFTRIWKVQETGTVGTVEFAIPQVGQGNTVYLVRSTNTTFDATDTWIPLSNSTVGSTTYLVGDIDFNNGDFFTIATFMSAPGCVAANLQMWFKADAGITGTTTVSNWADQSGNGRNVVQATAAAQPSTSGLMNFNPSLVFDGANDRLEYKAGRFMSTTSSGTFYGAATNKMDGGYENLGDLGIDNPHMGTLTNQQIMWMNGSSPVRIDQTGTLTADQVYSWGYFWNGGGPNVGSGLRIDGTEFYDATTEATAVGNGGVVDGMFTIGSYEGVENWNGHIAEVFLYDRNLTTAEKDRVETYLALRYGNTLKHNYLSGTGAVIYDTTGYANNIAGIGYELCQSLNQKQSHSENTGFQPIIGLARIDTTNAANPSVFATDASFMVWGSNNGATTFGTTITAPGSAAANNRMTRVWKVQETGTVGTVKFAIPQVGQGGAVYLVRSTNATFDAADTWVELFNYTIGSTSYLAGDIDFNNGDFFTIATMLTAPGCVASNLSLWLKADAGLTGTSTVTAWADQTPYSNPITVVGSPTLGNSFNFNPVVTLGATQYFTTPDATHLNPTASKVTVIGVTRPTVLDFNPILSKTVNSAWDNGFGLYGNANGKMGYWQGNQSGVEPANVPHMAYPTAAPFISTGYSTNNTTQFVSVNGANAVSATQNATTSTAQVEIGYAKTYQFNGDYAEVILYNEDIGDIGRQKVQSYLGVKYGITLSHNYLSGAGTTIYDRSNFSNNILGIGRDDCQSLNQKQSKSANATGKMTIGLSDTIAPSNPTHPSGFNQDASFIMIGDNAGTGTTAFPAGAACAPPPVVDKFTNLNYKVVETGSVQSIKVRFDAGGLSFNNSFPVFMQVASDAAFTNMIANVPMTWSGGNVQTNYDFPANATTYVRFAGNTTPLANLCEGDKTIDWWWHKNKWDWGTRSKTITDGDQTFTATITDAGNNILYPTWYPVSYGNSIYIPRYDKDNTGKVTFKIAMSKPSSNVSFPIYGVDAHWGLDKIKVIGTLSGGNVTPKLSKAKYSWVNISGDQAEGRLHHYAGYSHWGVTYVNFDSPVDEITVEYTKTTTYPHWKIYNYIGIGAFDITCQTPVPEVATPDNVYLFKQVKAASNKAEETFTYKFTIQNNNCSDRTISLSDNLPNTLTWIDSSLVSSITVGTENAYGNNRLLSLSNIVVPPGTSYIYVNAKGTTAGSYSNQATMTITGGGTHSSDDPSVSGASNPTVVAITPPAPAANLTITKAVNKATTEQNTEVTYTFNITNNGGSAVNTLFEDNLRGEAIYVASSLTGAPAGTQVSAYAGEGTLAIRDLNIAAGATVTMTIRANVGTTPVDSLLTNMAQVIPDINSGYRQVATTSNQVQTRITACNAGTTAPSVSATTLTNTCPTTTVNLNSLVTSTTPSGARLRWHTVATNPTAADSVATPSVLTASGTYYAYYFDATNNCYSPASVAVTATMNPVCTDTDGDGVTDNVDIDDDNDGVLDVIECVPTNLVTNGDFASGLTGWTNGGGWFASSGGAAINTDNAPAVSLKRSVTGLNTTNTHGEIKLSLFVAASNIANTPAYLNVVLAGTWYGQFRMENGVLDFVGYNGATANVTPVNIAAGTSGALAPVTITIPWISKPNTGDIDFQFTANLSDFSIDNVNILSFPVCDIDGDGTVNQLDLDSDGDGCSDAFEAGATTNLAANYKFTGAVGTNGLVNSLETVADNGVLNYTHTYSKAINNTIIACCTAGTTAPSVSATTLSNTCPATVANLGSITATNLPAGSHLTWHTATPATLANKVADSSMISASGTYYATFYDFNSGCLANGGNATTAVTVTLRLCTSTPPTVTPPAGGGGGGNAGTELNPIGGTAPYTYSNGSSDPLCVNPGGGAQPLPAGSNLTVNSSTGAYTYTVPTTVGTYYFCIKVCDNTSPTPICTVRTYTINVACGSGTVAPSLSTTNATNTCPATTVNLSSITATNLPAGAKLTWHTATPATLANKVVDSTAVVAGSTYYASFYDFANGCFGGSGANTTAVTTSSTSCVVVVRGSIKAFLSGSYVQASGMMHDSLRVKNLIPSAQPYAPSYTGTETVAPSVLAVTGNDAIVDWVLVELRSNPTTVVTRRAALIQRDGDIVDTDGISPLTFTAAVGSYHVVVRHRNHLGIMTANTVALTATTTSVDFTTSATTLYQRTDAFANANATRAFGSVRALWGGNASGNTNIIASGGGSDGSRVLSKVLMDNGNQATTSPSYIIYNQYQVEDVNMDGKTVYQGSGNELSTILLNILNHPSNTGYIATYIIYEQLP